MLCLLWFRFVLFSLLFLCVLAQGELLRLRVVRELGGLARCGRLGPSLSFFVLRLPHVTLIELRLALISYQDYHMLLIILAGRANAG